MNPINTFIDKDGIIYWDKFSNDPAPIPCPFSGRPCSGYCPHNYVFEGMNETILGFTCGQKQKGFEYEVNLKWHEKPTNIKFPYGVDLALKDNKEFLEALNSDKLEGSFGRFGVWKPKKKETEE